MKINIFNVHLQLYNIHEFDDREETVEMLPIPAAIACIALLFGINSMVPNPFGTFFFFFGPLPFFFDINISPELSELCSLAIAVATAEGLIQGLGRSIPNFLQ